MCRLGLKRTIEGVLEIAQAIYEVDTNTLFQPDPHEQVGEEEEGDSQINSQRTHSPRFPLSLAPLKMNLSLTLPLLLAIESNRV